MATSTKKVVKYEITKPNGRVIYRNVGVCNSAKKEWHIKQGHSIKEIKE